MLLINIWMDGGGSPHGVQDASGKQVGVDAMISLVHYLFLFPSFVLIFFACCFVLCLVVYFYIYLTPTYKAWPTPSLLFWLNTHSYSDHSCI